LWRRRKLRGFDFFDGPGDGRNFPGCSGFIPGFSALIPGISGFIPGYSGFIPGSFRVDFCWEGRGCGFFPGLEAENSLWGTSAVDSAREANGLDAESESGTSSSRTPNFWLFAYIGFAFWAFGDATSAMAD
jgi:hypothetical protein